MSRIVIGLGILFFIAFLLTGQHLERAVGPARPDEATRMMMRAYHIYLLLGSLLVVCTGLLEAPAGWRRKALGAGRALMVLATTAYLAGYFLEYGQGLEGRTMALPGSVLALVGVAVVGAARLPIR